MTIPGDAQRVDDLRRLLDQALEDVASLPEPVIYLSPDDLPGVTQVLGVPVERHASLKPGAGVLMDRRLLREWRPTTPLLEGQ